MAKKQNPEKDNFQDEAMKQEFRKGEEAGKSGSRQGSKQTSKRRRNPAGKGVYPVGGGSYSNHPRWHYPTQISLKDIASFPSEYILSKPITEFNFNNSSTLARVSDSNKKTRIPGICRVNLMPTLGEGGDNSALEQASLMMYQAIQAKNSRVPQFEPTDLMFYLVAVAQSYACYKLLCRVYAYARNFKQSNWYLPRSVMTAMNVNFNDLTSHLANFRSTLNLLALDLGNLYLPKSFDYIERQIYLYENIYMDAQDIGKAQLYMFMPVAFWQYVEGDPDHPLTYLKYREFLPANEPVPYLLKSDELLNILSDLIEPLRLSDDINNIGSDLKKAFGDNNRYTISQISEEFTMDPSYDKYFMSQMENAFIMPRATRRQVIPGSSTTPYYNFGDYTDVVANNRYAGVAYANPDINAGYIETMHAYYVDDQKYANADYNALIRNRENYLLNFHVQKPTPEDIVEAAALTAIVWQNVEWTSGGTPTNSLISGTFSTELCIGAQIFIMDNSSGVGYGWIPTNDGFGTKFIDFSSIMTENVYHQEQTSGAPTLVGWPVSCLTVNAALSAFDWHPRTQFFAVDDVLNATYFTNSLLDFETYCIVGAENLVNIKRMDMLGQFTPRTLPGITKIS